MKMGIDFSQFLDLSSKPKDIKPLDTSKFKTKKTGGVKFDYGIGDPMDYSPLTRVVVKEEVYNPNDYKVECGDLSLYCAAMFGGPLY